MVSASPHNFDESFQIALQHALGVVVSGVQRSHLLATMEPLLSNYKVDSFLSLAERLQARDADVCADVLNVVSQRQPDWSFNDEIKNILHKYIFAQLQDKASIWVVGCGHGQLAYLLLMDIVKYENESGKNKNFQLLASDVLEDDLKIAGKAAYGMQQLAALPDEDKKYFFTMDQHTDSGCIKDMFRQQITFSQCDLRKNFQSLGEMDLIVCPDVLVYFSNAVKVGIFKQFADILKPGGILLTGANQAVKPFTDDFELVEHPAGMFYRLKA